MYMTICEITLGSDKTINLECVATVTTHGKLVYFINFEKFALTHRPPHTMMSKIRRLCAGSSSWTLLDDEKKIIEWRDSVMFQQLDTTGMISSWKDILRNGNFTSIDSTNTLHLKNNTMFVKLDGFYTLCRATFNEDEYARLVISMADVLSDLNQRRFNQNSEIADLKATIKHLEGLIKKMYSENCSLQRQVRLCKDVFVKVPPKFNKKL